MSATTLPDGVDGDPKLYDETHTLEESLRVRGLAGQSVQNKIRIEGNLLGLVVDGLDEYLDERGIATERIPTTYSSWDDDFPGHEHGRRSHLVVEGPRGVDEEDGGSLALMFRSDLIRAALRILNGGGRYAASEYTLHLAVPYAVLSRVGGGAIIIAPITDDSIEVPEDPDFSYIEHADGTHFHVPPNVTE